MKVAILSANLGNFDKPIKPVYQYIQEEVEKIDYYCFTDEEFPPVLGLTSRFQYRIPKLFGFEMFPGYDIYIWIDGCMSLQNMDSVKWFLEQLGDADAAFFHHPQRKSILAESNYIEEKLNEGNKYMTSRYLNGLHKEMVKHAYEDPKFQDDKLLTSTAFIYRNNPNARQILIEWWFYQSRYFTCDQVSLPYAIYQASEAKVNVIKENQYKIPYLTLVSPHK